MILISGAIEIKDIKKVAIRLLLNLENLFLCFEFFNKLFSKIT